MGAINTLTRSLLNDAQANWATDTVITPYANSAYRTIQRKIANAGGDEFVTEVQLVVAAILAANLGAGTQTVINDATPAPNQLPSNLLIPRKIWERPNLSTQDFGEMEDLTNHGGLPSRFQGATLREWEWRTDGLYFVGATQDTQIRLRYTSAFPDLSGPTDSVLIRGAQEAIAYGSAALVGGARGSPLAEKMDSMFQDAMEELVIENVRGQQNAGTRRRSYNSRCRNRGRALGW